MKNSGYLLIMSAFIVGCSSGESEPKPTEKAVVSAVVLQEEAQEEQKTEGPKARLKKEVLVGGCQDSCESYQQAFHAYLTAAFDGKNGQGTIPFLETSEMIYNGAKIGSAWVELWRERKIDQRRDEISAFAKRVHEWVKLSKRDDLEVSLANQVTFTEDDGPGFLAYYKPPVSALEPGDLKEWRFRIQKRGWEWLVSEMTTRSVEP